MEKPKKGNRIVEALAATALIVGAASIDGGGEKIDKPKSEDSSVGVDRINPLAPKKDLEINSLPAREAEPKATVPESIQSETESLINQMEDNQNLKDKLEQAIEYSAGLVEDNRFKGEANERNYFEACYDEARWKEIQTYASEASQKTGVPKDILIAMGFIESGFQPSLSRSDTKVYGPLQMTLNAGKKAAEESKKIYGKEIKVESSEDLMEIKNGLKLAAIHLKNLEEKYGQWGLAVAAYSSGAGALERKIADEFPDVDVGASDREEMKQAAADGIKAKKTLGKLLLVKKSGSISRQQEKELSKVRAELSRARGQYKESEKLWREKLAKMPETFRKSGINIFTLFDSIQKKGEKIPHSLSYPLALDSISSKAKSHVEKSKG